MLEDFIWSTWSISYMKNEAEFRERNSESKYLTFYIVYLQLISIENKLDILEYLISNTKNTYQGKESR